MKSRWGCDLWRLFCSLNFIFASDFIVRLSEITTVAIPSLWYLLSYGFINIFLLIYYHTVAVGGLKVGNLYKIRISDQILGGPAVQPKYLRYINKY